MNHIEMMIAAAQNAYHAGKLRDAESIFSQLNANYPNHAQILQAHAIFLYQTGRRHEAIERLEAAIQQSPDVIGLRALVATIYNDLRYPLAYVKGRTHVEAALSQDPDNVNVLNLAALFYSKIGPILRYEQTLRRLHELVPADSAYATRLADYLAEKAQIDEAIDLYRQAIGLAGDQASAHMRNGLKELLRRKRVGDTSIVTESHYPNLDDIREDFRGFLKKQVLPTISHENRFLKPDSRIFTMGSCFARHVASALTTFGYSALTYDFTETMNTTYANRLVFDWALGRMTQQQVEEISELLSTVGTREQFLSNIKAADIMVLTMGVAACFFERKNGNFVMPKPARIRSGLASGDLEFRTTSVSENVANMTHVLSAIREINPNTQVVITVSPVPMAATFEYSSVVVADCVSKSTMRVVADELIRSNMPRLMYWPSFEIVRWIGPNISPTYGADDGILQHVNASIVEMIMSLFVEAVAVID